MGPSNRIKEVTISTVVNRPDRGHVTILKMFTDTHTYTLLWTCVDFTNNEHNRPVLQGVKSVGPPEKNCFAVNHRRPTPVPWVVVRLITIIISTRVRRTWKSTSNSPTAAAAVCGLISCSCILYYLSCTPTFVYLHTHTHKHVIHLSWARRSWRVIRVGSG